MSVGLSQTTKLFLLLVLFILIPSVLGAENCKVVNANQCSESGWEEIASLSDAYNAHAAAPDHASFNQYSLCCEEDFTQDYYAPQWWGPVMSIAIESGSQGHVGEPSATNFDYNINGSYQDCVLEAREAEPAQGEVCVAEISGSPQGHISACGETQTDFPYQLICCQFGLERNAQDNCVQTVDNEVTINSLEHSTGEVVVPAGQNIDERFEANVTWAYDEPIEYRMNRRPDGTSDEDDVLTGTDSDLSGTNIIFPYVTQFNTVGDYEVVAYFNKEDNSQDDTAVLDVRAAETCLGNAQNDFATAYAEACESTTTNLDGDLDWTARNSYYCMPDGSNTCYTGTCPAGSEFNASENTCQETNCEDVDSEGNPVDNDRDGLANFADVDCNNQDNPPVINEFSATPLTGSAELSVTFVANISDEYGNVQYSIDYGDGNSYAQSGSLEIWDTVTHTYTQPGTYTATLTATDRLDQTNTSSVTIEAVNLPPTVTLSLNPQATSAPNTTLITVNVTDDSPNVTVQLNRGSQTTLFFEQPYTEEQTVEYFYPYNDDITISATANIVSAANACLIYFQHQTNKTMKLKIIQSGASNTAPSITLQKSGILSFNEPAAEKHEVHTWGNKLLVAIDEQEQPFQTLFLIPAEDETSGAYNFRPSKGKYKIWSVQVGKALEAAGVDYKTNMLRFSYQGKQNIEGHDAHVLKKETIIPRKDL